MKNVSSNLKQLALVTLSRCNIYMNSRKVSGIKVTHGSKMFPTVKKQIKNILFTGTAFLKVVFPCI